MTKTNLVLIHNPALELLIVAIVAASFLDNVIDREVLETGTLGEGFAVRGLTYTRCARDDYVWLSPHRVL